MALAWLCAGFLAAVAAAGVQAQIPPPADAGAVERNIHSLPPPPENTPFYGALSWTGETVSNLSGGLKTGTRADSLVLVGFAANSDAIGLPPDGRLKISFARIDSGRPSVNLVGDTQVVSNISASSVTRLYQFWYRQDFFSKRLQLRAGLIDLNQYFDVLESASDLVNSSFGISPGISADMPASIYPKPGAGLMMRWRENGEAFGVGLFQGNPLRRETVFHNGHSVIAEWQPQGYQSDSVHVRLGLWQWQNGTGPVNGARHAWGAYGSIQASMSRLPDLTMFAHLAVSPGPRSPTPFSAALGVSMPSPLGGHRGDRISLGMTRQDLRGLAAETSLEATYVLPFTDNMSIQPDLQYVINPGGRLPDAVVFTLRLVIQMETHFHRDTGSSISRDGESGK